MGPRGTCCVVAPLPITLILLVLYQLCSLRSPHQTGKEITVFSSPSDRSAAHTNQLLVHPTLTPSLAVSAHDDGTLRFWDISCTFCVSLLAHVTRLSHLPQPESAFTCPSHIPTSARASPSMPVVNSSRPARTTVTSEYGTSVPRTAYRFARFRAFILVIRSILLFSVLLLCYCAGADGSRT